MIVRTRTAIFRDGELRDPYFPQLYQLVELVDQELEETSASLSAVHVGRRGAEDVVEDAADAFGVRGQRVAVDLHEEDDGAFVLVMGAGVPGPFGDVGVRVERDGAIAYREAGLHEPVE